MARALSVAALMVAAGLVFAQPAIDVASIKPADPALTAMNNHFSADRFTPINYAAQSLIENAFGVRDYQVLNAPDWTRSEGWTLEIKTTAPTSYEQKFRLLQPLLAERFRLRFHHETKIMPVFSLLVAKGGPKLKTPTDDKPGSTRYGNQIIGHKYDISRLARDLSSNVLNRPVIDETGLRGIYDIDLKWTPDSGQIDQVGAPVVDPDRPSIFVAIREQLGLELKAEKGPVDVIVIDHVERPSPN
jgi:uncharacterized protein (TIGR03435 family)